MTTAIIPSEEKQTALAAPGFGTTAGFELLQRQAKLLASSELVPPQFKDNVANCTIALEMASRMGASPLAVVQNIYVVHGRPSWSSPFIIASVNAGGRFTPLRFEFEGVKGTDAYGCKAVATDKESGERLEGTLITIAMAKAEGWYDKNGSKWKTMPEQMLRYRSASFWARSYSPETLMGMRTVDEEEDIGGFESAKAVSEERTTSKIPEETQAPAKPVEVVVEPPALPKTRKPTEGGMTDKDKLAVLLEEIGMKPHAFESLARKAGYITATQTIDSVSTSVLAQLVENFKEITK